MKKMMFFSKNWYFPVQKALIYYTVNKSDHNSFILLVFSHVANFRYVANFRFLTLYQGVFHEHKSDKSKTFVFQIVSTSFVKRKNIFKLTVLKWLLKFWIRYKIL